MAVRRSAQLEAARAARVARDSDCHAAAKAGEELPWQAQAGGQPSYRPSARPRLSRYRPFVLHHPSVNGTKNVSNAGINQHVGAWGFRSVTRQGQVTARYVGMLFGVNCVHR